MIVNVSMARGSRFAVHGSRFTVRGSRFAVHRSRFAVRGPRQQKKKLVKTSFWGLQRTLALDIMGSCAMEEHKRSLQVRLGQHDEYRSVSLDPTYER